MALSSGTCLAIAILDTHGLHMAEMARPGQSSSLLPLAKYARKPTCKPQDDYLLKDAPELHPGTWASQSVRTDLLPLQCKSSLFSALLGTKSDPCSQEDTTQEFTALSLRTHFKLTSDAARLPANRRSTELAEYERESPSLFLQSLRKPTLNSTYNRGASAPNLTGTLNAF